jgi:hypothetical protein
MPKDTSRTYHLAGSISHGEMRTDRNGRPYAVAMFHTHIHGLAITRRLMIFGTMVERLRPYLTNRETFKIAGAFEGGTVKALDMLPATAATESEEPRQGSLLLEMPVH